MEHIADVIRCEPSDQSLVVVGHSIGAYIGFEALALARNREARFFG